MAHACVTKDCDGCVGAWTTKIIDEHYQVFPAKTFHLEIKEEKGPHDIFYCIDGTLPCSCMISTCTGSSAYCLMQKCTHGAPCTCQLKAAKATMMHYDNSGIGYENFEIISVKECFFNLTK